MNSEDRARLELQERQEAERDAIDRRMAEDEKGSVNTLGKGPIHTLDEVFRSPEEKALREVIEAALLVVDNLDLDAVDALDQIGLLLRDGLHL